MDDANAFGQGDRYQPTSLSIRFVSAASTAGVRFFDSVKAGQQMRLSGVVLVGLTAGQSVSLACRPLEQEFVGDKLIFLLTPTPYKESAHCGRTRIPHTNNHCFCADRTSHRDSPDHHEKRRDSACIQWTYLQLPGTNCWCNLHCKSVHLVGCDQWHGERMLAR
jgi:hypothetical protein